MKLTTNQLALRQALWAAESRLEGETGRAFELADWLAILIDMYGLNDVEGELLEMKENDF
jgi:hypothetical protein